LGIGEIKELIELLSQAKSEQRYAVLPQIPLELVIVGWGISKTEEASVVTETKGAVKIEEKKAPVVSEVASPNSQAHTAGIGKIY